jgi:hypothetical protein
MVDCAQKETSTTTTHLVQIQHAVPTGVSHVQTLGHGSLFLSHLSLALLGYGDGRGVAAALPPTVQHTTPTSHTKQQREERR